MDKNCIMDDKLIEISQTSRLHRLIAGMPDDAREYGLWLINGTAGSKSPAVPEAKALERRFEFYSLSHMYSGKGWIKTGSRVQEISPGDSVLICPGDWHWYGAVEGNFYIEDAVRFCGRIPDFMRKKGLLRSGIYPMGSVRKLVPLIELSRSPAPDSQLKSAIGLQQILMEMINSEQVAEPVESLLETIHNAPDNHWWSVGELAELRGVSIDRLRREFRKHTGVLPKHYLEHFKLRRAAEYLTAFSASVTETALHFGYVDRYHFSRRFKSVFGLSPEQYRKLFAQHPEP
ncbi:MAG: helix-turn-helix transcriptional regulator [Lentisphaerae bacterium]|nr:helix-turn-helix transcriptional regulator [Lentisphaerota bacterium]